MLRDLTSEIKFSYKLIVVGGGPNGYSFARQAVKIFGANNVLLIEKNRLFSNLFQMPNVRWHSTMRELDLGCEYTKKIDLNYHPTTKELINYYELAHGDNKVDVLYDEVLDIQSSEDGRIEIKCCKSQSCLSSKYVILCTGIYQNPRKLPQDKHNICQYNSNMNHKGLNTALIGAGNSSIDYIIYTLPFNKITWFIRDKITNIRPNLRNAYEEAIQKYSKNLIIVKNYSSLELNKNKTIVINKNQSYSGFDRVDALLGFNSRSQLSDSMKLSYDGEALKLDKSYQTSIKNVYAFGSLMSSWNHEKNAPQQTFIHNGNLKQRDIIFKDIMLKELSRVGIPLSQQPDKSPQEKKLTSQIKYLLKSFFNPKSN